MAEIDLKTVMMALEKVDSIAIADREGRYIYTNKNWSKKTGVSAEDAYGKYIWQVVPETPVRQLLKDHKPILGYLLDGKSSSVVNYYPLFDESGTFFGILVWMLYSSVEIALHYSRQIQQLSHELSHIKGQLENYQRASYSINNIVGVSQAIKTLKQEIADCARTSSTVLIEGESGVGKELVAHSIHDLSERSRGRFVRVNCSAIPPELMESEFFGYEEGAFTGARRGGKKGKFELASGGSIFLDEVNSLPLTMQPKFLRVLQEHEVERVGGQDAKPVDIRVIAAANGPLEPMVQEGTFRLDLYYRLNVVYIRVPPLREHLEDIPVLTRYLIDKLNHDLGTEVNYPDDDVMSILMDYSWPGNTRQLQNVLERALNRCHGHTIRPEHIQLSTPDLEPGRAERRDRPEAATIREQRDALERSVLEKTLAECRYNKSDAAQWLGISRTALYKKLKKYGLK